MATPASGRQDLDPLQRIFRHCPQRMAGVAKDHSRSRFPVGKPRLSVGQLENGASYGILLLTPFLVGRGEKFLEVGPGLEVRWLALP